MNVVDVRVRPSHPTGTYRRAGLTFHTNEATVLDLDTLAPDVRERIEADGWLDLRPVKDAAPEEPPPMIVTVPAWLVEAYAGDREAIQYALDFRLGHLAPPAEAAPEEPRRTRRKANHEADPEPEFGPPAEG